MLRARSTIIALVLIAGCSRSQEAPPPRPAADIETGQTIAAACANCHGLDGKSTGPEMPHLAAQNLGYLAYALRAYRQKTRGSAPMQDAVRSLTDADVENVAAYYASLEQPKPIGVARSAAVKPLAQPAVAAGRAAASACAGCHGADGNSAIAGTPNMAGQDASYLAAALRAYKDGSRRHAVMQGAAAALSDRDIMNLAAFYAAQAPRPPKARVPLPPEAWAEKCDRCHEPGIENPILVFPRIKGQPAGYIAKALKSYQEESARASAMMHAMAGPLTEEEIGALAEYYARQQPR